MRVSGLTNSPWAPAAMVVGSVFMATLEAVFMRQLGELASQGQILLFRSGIQLFLVLVIGSILLRSVGAVLVTKRLREHLLRGSLAAFSWWCYYMSFKSLTLALATTLTFSSQLFVLLLAWPILRERVTRPQLVATLVGFVGVMVAARIWNPFSLGWGVSYGLASALIGAVMILITRSLSFTDRNETILFYMSLVVFLSAIPQSFFGWIPMTGISLTLLILMSLVGTMGAWLIVEAYRRAEATSLAPYGYTRLIFAAGLGYWFFGDQIQSTTIAGAALIVASTLGLWLISRRHARG